MPYPTLFIKHILFKKKLDLQLSTKQLHLHQALTIQQNLTQLFPHKCLSDREQDLFVNTYPI